MSCIKMFSVQTRSGDRIFMHLNCLIYDLSNGYCRKKRGSFWKSSDLVSKREHME